MDRFRPNELNWGAPVFAAGLALFATWLVTGGILEAQSGSNSPPFDPGFGAVALPMGLMAAISLALAAWARRTRHPLLGLILSVYALLSLGLLFVSSGAAAQQAQRCPDLSRVCSSIPYKPLYTRAQIAAVLTLLDLLATGLLVLNALDGYRNRPRIR